MKILQFYYLSNFLRGHLFSKRNRVHMYAPIRSWSGGRLFEGSDSSSFDSELGEADGKKNIASLFQDVCGSDFTSCDDSYDDDFSNDDFTNDDESFYTEEISSQDNNNMRRSLEDMHDLHTSKQMRSCDDEKYQTDDEYSFDGTDSSLGSSSTPSTPIQCGIGLKSCIEPHLIYNKHLDTAEHKTFLKANLQHKKWLVAFQDKAKLEKEIEDKKRVKLEKKRMKRRNILVIRARNRRDVGYNVTTEAAKNNRVQTQKVNGTENYNPASENEEKKQHDRKKWQKNKRKYRKYLDGIIKRRGLEYAKEELARVQAEKMRMNATTIVLDEIKRKRKSPNKSGDECKSTEKITTHIQMSKNENGEGNQSTNAPVGNLNIREFKKRCSAEFTKIILERRRKEREAERLKRRLEKRATILRQQYEQNLSQEKPWERIIPIDPGNSQGEEEQGKANEGQNFHLPSLKVECDNQNFEMSKVLLTPSKVKALTERLCSKKRSDKVIERKDNFDTWKRQNGVEPKQKVYCMTGWYPSVS